MKTLLSSISIFMLIGFTSLQCKKSDSDSVTTTAVTKTIIYSDTSFTYRYSGTGWFSINSGPRKYYRSFNASEGMNKWFSLSVVTSDSSYTVSSKDYTTVSDLESAGLGQCTLMFGDSTNEYELVSGQKITINIDNGIYYVIIDNKVGSKVSGGIENVKLTADLSFN